MSLTIYNFFDKFGTDTTTNFQLMKWSKDLEMPKVHIIMKNELSDLKKFGKNKIYFIICNYQTTKEVGIHWVALYKNSSKHISFYFDSYGIIPFKEAIDFLDTTDRYYSTFQIQKPNTNYCGVLCLFVLYQLYKGKDFFDIILSLKNEL
jgi:hypothetical protein